MQNFVTHVSMQMILVEDVKANSTIVCNEHNLENP